MEVFTKRLSYGTYKFVRKYCTVCGNAFDAKLTDINKGKGTTCSLSCAGKLGAAVTNNKIPANSVDYIRYNNSHEIVRKAKETGRLKPEPCVVCGSLKTVGHHDDYDKPEDVIWFCHKHHMQHHAKLNSQK